MRSRRRWQILLTTADQFLTALRTSALLAEEQLARLEEELRLHPRTARTWAHDLVERGMLTGYQAEQLLAGRGGQLVLGQYRILDHVGAGGMGQVYKAEHILMRRRVALKIIAVETPPTAAFPSISPVAENGCSSSTVDHFYREIQASAQLCHPNIVTAFDAAVVDGIYYLVMEYVDGLDLDRLVREIGPLPVRWACECIRQAALGLQYAHEHKLVHCDIKPANLLVTGEYSLIGWAASQEGTPPIVKILDLGLAKLSSTAGATSKEAHDAGNELAGTPDYMAPERALDIRLTDIRSDLYSLGCTFYYLLTGTVPYPGGTWTEKLVRHRIDPVPEIKRLRPDVPAEIVSVAARLMAKDPDERYAAPAILAADLQAYLMPSSPEQAVRTNLKTALPTSSQHTMRMARSVQTMPACPGALTQTGLREHLSDGDLGAPSTMIAFSGSERPRLRRKRLPWSMVAMAIAVGIFLAWLARHPLASYHTWWLKHPIIYSSQTASAPPAFLLDRTSHRFSSLHEAVAAAKDGDTLTIEGEGPFRSGPISCLGKALTLRAGAGYRPRIHFVASSNCWLPCLETDRPLTIRGCSFFRDHNPQEPTDTPETPFISCAHASLRLDQCHLDLADESMAIVCRHASQIQLDHCQITAAALALCVEVGQTPTCEILVRDTTLEIKNSQAAALSIWASEIAHSTKVRLRLENNQLQAGRIIACSHLPAILQVTAQGNHFVFKEAMFSCANPSCWSTGSRAIDWHGAENQFVGETSWLRGAGAPSVGGLESWRAFWNSSEQGSLEFASATAPILHSPQR